MDAIELIDATIGTVSSREDGSVAFRVITAELRPSEKGLVMDYHGRACAVTIKPHQGEPDKTVKVATERTTKTPSQRLYNTLFVLWKQEGGKGIFDEFYNRSMEAFINSVKEQLP